MSFADSPRKRLAILAMGAASGLLVAGTSIFLGAARKVQTLPEGAVARVAERVITREAYERQLTRLASDRRNPMTPADRRFVLDRLIDEELLIRRGLEIGLAQSSRSVRRAISSAMINQIVTDSAAQQPSPRQLENFYRENRDFFSGPGRLWVRHLRVPLGPDPESSRDRAWEIRTELESGAAFDEVRARLPGSEARIVPDGLLPPTKLAEYLGPTLTQVALSLKPGSLSDPVRTDTGYSILLLVDREPPRSPPFKSAAPQVQKEFQRRAGDRALREYLDWLRRRSDVVIRPEFSRKDAE